jgi:hypothetical protein
MRKLFVFFILVVVAIACNNEKPDKAVIGVTVAHTLLSGPFSKVYVDFQSFSSGGYNRYSQFEWIVNGVSIKVDSLGTYFDVPAREGFDTLVFINRIYNQDPEVILCDLQPNEDYLIFYNACCGDFYLWIKDKDKRGREKSVSFILTDKVSKKLIGGVFPAASFLRTNKKIEVKAGFRHSPMLPNRYKIFAQEFQPESPDTTMARIVDPTTGKELMAFKDIETKIISFNYIFLKDDTLEVIVDSKSLSVNVLKTNKLK